MKDYLLKASYQFGRVCGFVFAHMPLVCEWICLIGGLMAALAGDHAKVAMWMALLGVGLLYRLIDKLDNWDKAIKTVVAIQGLRAIKDLQTKPVEVGHDKPAST
jgi:hypothetical protein